MMNKNIIVPALLFMTLVTNACYSQNYTDVQYRFSPSVDYEITKKWQVAFEYRYSLHKDLEAFKSSSLEFGTKYDITKKISLGTGYRFYSSFEKDSHRLFLDFQYKQKINKKFKVNSKTSYQFRTGSFDADYMQHFKEPSHYFREKVTLDYNIPKSKTSIYLAPEVFLKYDNNNKTAFELNRMRYTVGMDYRFKYGNTLGLSLFYEDKSNPQKTDRFVFTTKYNLSLNDLIHKKEKKEKKKNKENKINKLPQE